MTPMTRVRIPKSQESERAQVSTSDCPRASFEVSITDTGLCLKILEGAHAVSLSGEDIHIDWRNQASDATATLHFCRPSEGDRTVGYDAFQVGWLVDTLDSPDQPKHLPFMADLMLGGDVELTLPKQPPGAVYMFSLTAEGGTRLDPKIYNKVPTGGPD
jgi:hypothetical protein